MSTCIIVYFVFKKPPCIVQPGEEIGRICTKSYTKRGTKISKN